MFKYVRSTRKIIFSIWGVSLLQKSLLRKFEGDPTYTILRDSETPLAAVTRSIESRTKLSWEAPPRHLGGDDNEHYYQGILGVISKDGGWVEITELRFSVPTKLPVRSVWVQKSRGKK